MMIQMRRVASIGIALCLAVFGCRSANDPYTMRSGQMQAWARKQPALSIEDRADSSEFALASNSVAFKLFQACDAPGKNVLISPLSIATSLAVLGNGAKGSTQQAIYDAINCPGGAKPVNE